MVRTIITDLTVLSQVCQEVPEELTDQITTDLLDTAKRSKNCIGLAAPQIGHPYRAFVMKTPKGWLVVVNPVVVDRKGHIPGKEGCLSRPGVTVTVFRPHKMTVQFGGKQLQIEGNMARVFDHEFAHLDGEVIGNKKNISRAA